MATNLEGFLETIVVFQNFRQKRIDRRGTSTVSSHCLASVFAGIWPEHESFKDDGYGDIPAKWKGECVSSVDFPSSLCNRHARPKACQRIQSLPLFQTKFSHEIRVTRFRKLIGAKVFNKGWLASGGRGELSPRDREGHGTHTSSTAAGSRVDGANYLGIGEGKRLTD